jgi:hypothetical protein
VRSLLVAALALSCSCESFFAPYENPTRTVEGCNEAVAHLLACCPKWDSYLSCTYLDHAIPQRDLTVEQSACLQKTACDDIARAVTGGDRLCSLQPATRHCR